ncbi:Uncharacterized protein OBRU01_08159 [Operophtera brumata]|uniref:Uncharacterized protein n=1 Tax=Operophtera brumata TaxID=104452 RepID=A0A0L7LHW1_OPEBR|nr:Uncharacterized protein OBRU01_08159 [Operophtera brumata]
MWPYLSFISYNYAEYIELPRATIYQETPVVASGYKSPQIVQDPDLSKRVAALEERAFNIDNRLNFFDQKLSKIDNLEAQIEQYSFKYLQQNLIQVFNTENTEVLAEKLKNYFDKYYMTSEQLQILSREVHERLISTWKPDMDEDAIRRLIQEYMSVFEKKQMQVISERLQQYVREVEIHHTNTGTDIEAVKRVVAGMLNVYDADKTGLVDYALESAGIT